MVTISLEKLGLKGQKPLYLAVSLRQIKKFFSAPSAALG
jgi:hypothetical protein